MLKRFICNASALNKCHFLIKHRTYTPMFDPEMLKRTRERMITSEPQRQEEIKQRELKIQERISKFKKDEASAEPKVWRDLTSKEIEEFKKLMADEKEKQRYSPY